jgi:FkbM family methyltransferase
MLQASPELRICADSHEKAVIFDDEYGIRVVQAMDPSVEYVVDIGGNVGCFSIQVLRFFPNAKILLCEPDTENMKYAMLNVADRLTGANGQVTYVPKAIIGDPTVKEVKFNICGWGGNHHVDGHFRWDLFTPMGSRLVGSVQCPATTLKEIMDENGFPRIDLLKIDCEGLEGEILQSFKPWMGLVKHFRGEWHGQEDIPLIQDAFAATHKTMFDRRYTTHGDIIAEPLP